MREEAKRSEDQAKELQNARRLQEGARRRMHEEAEILKSRKEEEGKKTGF